MNKKYNCEILQNRSKCVQAIKGAYPSINTCETACNKAYEQYIELNLLSGLRPSFATSPYRSILRNIAGVFSASKSMSIQIALPYPKIYASLLTKSTGRKNPPVTAKKSPVTAKKQSSQENDEKKVDPSIGYSKEDLKKQFDTFLAGDIYTFHKFMMMDKIYMYNVLVELFMRNLGITNGINCTPNLIMTIPINKTYNTWKTSPAGNDIWVTQHIPYIEKLHTTNELTLRDDWLRYKKDKSSYTVKNSPKPTIHDQTFKNDWESHANVIYNNPSWVSNEQIQILVNYISGNDIAIVPIGILPLSKLGGHANLLIINPTIKEFLYIEPHGETHLQEIMLRRFIFGSKLTKHIVTGTNTWKWMNLNNIQIQGDDSFCTVWSMLTGLLYLLNPGTDIKNLMDNLLLSENKSFRVTLLLITSFYMWTELNRPTVLPEDPEVMKKFDDQAAFYSDERLNRLIKEYNESSQTTKDNYNKRYPDFNKGGLTMIEYQTNMYKRNQEIIKYNRGIYLKNLTHNIHAERISRLENLKYRDEHKQQTDQLIDFYKTFDVKKVTKTKMVNTQIGVKPLKSIDIGIINLEPYTRYKRTSPYSLSETNEIKARNEILKTNKYLKQEIKKEKNSQVRERMRMRLSTEKPLSENIVRLYNIERGKSWFSKYK